MQLSSRKPACSRTSLIVSAYIDNTDLAILLNKDTFEPEPVVLTFKADSTSKGILGTVLFTVRGFLRRPSLSGSPTVTFCSVHIHNVVAKKRDASTELLHGKMLEYKVDFIGGDFNMSAFSFSDPGHSCLWGLGALDEQHRECTGFLVMPKRPCEWRVDSHGCYKIENSALGLGPRDQSAHLPVFLHLRNTNLPGPSSISCVVSKHNKEDLSVNMIKNVCRDDGNAHDRASLYQGKPFLTQCYTRFCWSNGAKTTTRRRTLSR